MGFVAINYRAWFMTFAFPCTKVCLLQHLLLRLRLRKRVSWFGPLDSLFPVTASARPATAKGARKAALTPTPST
eukprot:3674147-Pleurochrysis_carterae.AAC.6